MAYAEDDFEFESFSNGSSRATDGYAENALRAESQVGGDVFPGDATPIETRNPEGEMIPISEMSVGGDERHEGDGASEDGRCLKNDSVIKFAIAAVLALVVVWLSSMLTPIVQNVFQCRGWSRAAAVMWLLIPLGAMAYAAFLGFRVFKSLHPSVKVKASEYRGRRHDKGSIIDLKHLLKREYLSHFPLNSECRAQIGDSAFEKMRMLMEDGQILPDEWLDDFRKFQEDLSEEAKVIVANYATKVGFATGASPNRKLDIIITLYISAEMLMSVANLFKHRMTKVGALRIAIIWSFNLWMSGQLQRTAAKAAAEVAGAGARIVAQYMSPDPVVIPYVSGKAAKTLAKAATSKVIEGGVNAFLARKLGEKAIHEFLPVDFDLM